MSPYLYLRRWWRRTTSGNRATTSVAAVVVLALAAWIFSPTGGDDATTVAGIPAGGAAGGAVAGAGGGEDVGGAAGAAPVGDTGEASGATGAPAATSGTGARTTTGSTVAATGAPSDESASPACAQAPAGTPGVSDKTITIAAIVLNLAGPIGNTSQGLATPDEFRRMGDTVAADINARGGVQCRKIEMKYYDANPLNQDQQRSVCLQVVQDKPFMAVDFAGFAFPPTAAGCLPQQKVPFIGVNLLLDSDVQRFKPYLATITGNHSIAIRDGVLGLKERGFFDPAKGFKKLGVMAENCAPEVIKAFDDAVQEAGVPSSQVSKFNFSCPTGGFAPPNEMGQAVNQHRLDGVTHMIPLTGSGSFSTYTNIAQSQRFRPFYGIMEYGNIPTSQGGSQKANAENFNDNNIIITVTRRGSESPGQQLDEGTKRCQGILAKAGLPPSHVFQAGGGFVCSELWMAAAGIARAQSLTREQALPGLFNAGPVQLAYPAVDTTFRGPAKFFGGDSWWPIQYQGGCGCFRPLDPNRRPSFAR
jgi:hypothetical protein